MARGWESKSIESQQDAAEARGRGNDAARPPLSQAEQEIAALEHTRSHLLHEIAASCNPRFRDLKHRALAHVDARIAALRK